MWSRRRTRPERARARRTPPVSWNDGDCLHASRSPLADGGTADCGQSYPQSHQQFQAPGGVLMHQTTDLDPAPVTSAPEPGDGHHRASQRRAGNTETYRQLREAITGGRFQPNERLVEAEL